MMSARGSLLSSGLIAPPSSSIYTPETDLRVEITRIFLHNSGAGAHTVTLFHDDTGGAAFILATTLRTFALAAGASAELEAASVGSGIHVSPTGQIALNTSGPVNEVVFHLYGITAVAADWDSSRITRR